MKKLFAFILFVALATCGFPVANTYKFTKQSSADSPTFATVVPGQGAILVYSGTERAPNSVVSATNGWVLTWDSTAYGGLGGWVAAAGASGGGTVTSFSAGDLSPLFTTSEATSTTTPALTFSLSNAAQNAFFAGPSTGGAGAPAYRAIVADDVPTLTLAKISDDGTAAALNVPASGDAASGEVVKGDDSRLTNQRTPSDSSVTMAKLATMTDVTTHNAGTSAHGFMPKLNSDGTYQGQRDVWILALSDETTALTTGAAKVTFRAPRAATVTGVRASVNTVSSSGLPTFDVNEAGVSIFSTTLTIDASEKTSVTAATAAVISDSAIADDAEITVDIDTAGTGAKGAKLEIYVTY